MSGNGQEQSPVHSRLTWIARFLVALMIVAAVASIVAAMLLSFRHGVPNMMEEVLIRSLLAICDVAVGGLILARYPRHVVGWLLLAMGFLFVSSIFVGIPIVLSENGPVPVSDPIIQFVKWISLWDWIPQFTLPIVFFPLFFPTGRLLSRRWRIVLVAGVAGMLSFMVANAVTPAYEDQGGLVTNPYVVPGGEAIAGVLGVVQVPLMTGAFLGSLVSMVIRYRRGGTVERRQMKWLFYPIGVAIIWWLGIIALLDLFAPQLSQQIQAVSSGFDFWLLSAAIPIAIGIAILRHHLLDIDVIIRKTLIYGVLTAMVVLVYSLVVAGTTTALQTQNNAFLTVLALGVAAVAFIPARRRLTHLVNRYLPYTPPSTEMQVVKVATDEIKRAQTKERTRAERGLILLSRIIFALSVVLALAVATLWVAGQQEGASSDPQPLSELLWMIAIVLANGIVALLIIKRYPRHFVAWGLLVVSFSTALMGFSGDYAMSFAHSTPALSTPSVIFFGWVARWIWLPFAVTPFIFIPHFFPDGRLLSGRWRIPAAAAPAGLLVAVISWAINPYVGPDLVPVPNPVDLGLTVAQADLLFENVAMPLFLVASLGGFASVFLRYRRSGAIRRAQMKWVLYVLGMMFVIGAAEQLLPLIAPEGVRQLLEDLDYSNQLVWIYNTLIPIAMGIAILRYRLFDIDLIIRRTLIYAVVTASLATVYFGSVVLLQQLSAGVSGEQSPVAIVISTLLIAALFSRLRRRVQAFIDRRFFRAKYDSAQTLAGFAQAARDEMDLEALTTELVSVVQATMQPERVGVWLRPGSSGGVVAQGGRGTMHRAPTEVNPDRARSDQ